MSSFDRTWKLVVLEVTPPRSCRPGELLEALVDARIRSAEKTCGSHCRDEALAPV